ncbi:DegT/DnrJ/EryC1/StrS family aminotransferase [Collinsella intestinalis]|uniref:ATP-grasp domain-containing protein n=1 Tax=Collinsella intestinalis TaxID=147207 RepID=A0A414NHE6_9ACTN|nr:DegT/DnrJ/EryC1/StrS family aminotransferase [Collinsella intestinalis]RHF39153.1 hypothetical protein DW682_05690 [Collinsella intestinalis]
MHRGQYEYRIAEIMAEKTGTSPDDWYCVYRAREGMQVVFESIRAHEGSGEVLTQLLTCCTAVNPIIAAGLIPVYGDISRDTASLDPRRLPESTSLRAIVLQHTYGIVDASDSRDLVRAAHSLGALVIEDCAHGVTRMATDEQGVPVADFSIHSFGVEKILHTQFGGAVWVNPGLSKGEVARDVRDRLGALRPAGAYLTGLTGTFLFWNRVFNHLPGCVARPLRRVVTAARLFEPAVSDAERMGQMDHAPMRPSEKISRRVVAAFEDLDSDYESRSRVVSIYHQAFSGISGVGSFSAADEFGAQPLLKFPILVEGPMIADAITRACCAAGYYTSTWYRPELGPGVIDPCTYRVPVDRRGVRVCDDIIDRLVTLPTDCGEEGARRVIEIVEAHVGTAAAECEDVRMSCESLDESDLASCLRPVVLGGDVLAYSYGRCFFEAYGVKTQVISAVNVRVTSSSKFIDYVLDSTVGGSIEELYLMLRRRGIEMRREGKIPLLLGSADWQVRSICELKNRLADLYVIPYNDFDVFDRITQKGNFYALCEELGMPYPKTWTFDCSGGAQRIDPVGLMYPAIAKPSNSACYDTMAFDGKEKIYTVSSRDDLQRVFDLLQRVGYDKDLVVQEFIPGPDDSLCSLTTFSTSDGDVRVVSGGRVLLEDHDPARIGNPVAIQIERHDQLVDDAKRFCMHVGYVGFANFDAKYDERDGKYKFFEVNARPGANTYYMSAAGVNFVKPLVESFVLGKDVPYQEAYDDVLYTLVPKRVIRDYVFDVDARRRALDLYKSRRVANPFDSPGETLAHRLWARVRWVRQIDKFKRYMG